MQRNKDDDMADIFKKLTPEDMVQMIGQQLEKIDTAGTDDMIRLRRELEQVVDDASLWFDYGLALNQAALHRDALVVEREQFLHPEAEELNVDCSGSTPLYEEALKSFGKVLELEPEYYGVQTQLGLVYGNMHRLEEAVQCYRKALEEDEEDFSAAYYLGLTYRDLGDESAAQRYLTLARELNPDDDTLVNSRGEEVEN